MDHVLLVLSSVDGHLGCWHLRATVTIASCRWVCTYLFEGMLPVLLGVDPGVESPGRSAFQFLGTGHLLSSADFLSLLC